MEYEIIERPRRSDRGGDSRMLREQRAFKALITDEAADYPEHEDRAVLIPEQERD